MQGDATAISGLSGTLYLGKLPTKPADGYVGVLPSRPPATTKVRVQMLPLILLVRKCCTFHSWHPCSMQFWTVHFCA